jgi:two-component system, OmpR family, manganese sensing response regulator
MQRVLLVEDDVSMADLLVLALEGEDYLVDHAADGATAIAFLDNDIYNLILLDWNLPDLSGIEILRRYRRAGGSATVLMLTAQAHTDSKLTGFDSGADDYLTKPYELKELLARMRALLRRPPKLEEEVVIFKNLEFHCKERKFYVNKVEVKLAPRELSLIELFMKHPGELLSAEAILLKIWGYSDNASIDALRTSIRRLRNSIKSINECEDSGSLIENVSKLGYRLRKDDD